MTFSLKNHLLISMPVLQDPNFDRTVSLICQHDENGAVGVIINRLSGYHMGEIFEQLNVEYSNLVYAEKPVYQGGPVQPELGLVVHEATREWDSTLPISDDLSLTSSQDIVHAMADGDAPDNCILALGYAGWGPGQLEIELQQNSWLSVAADQSIIFKTPIEKRWHDAAALIGVDISQITGTVGHA